MTAHAGIVQDGGQPGPRVFDVAGGLDEILQSLEHCRAQDVLGILAVAIKKVEAFFCDIRDAAATPARKIA